MTTQFMSVRKLKSTSKRRSERKSVFKLIRVNTLHTMMYGDGVMVLLKTTPREWLSSVWIFFLERNKRSGAYGIYA